MILFIGDCIGKRPIVSYSDVEVLGSNMMSYGDKVRSLAYSSEILKEETF